MKIASRSRVLNSRRRIFSDELKASKVGSTVVFLQNGFKVMFPYRQKSSIPLAEMPTDHKDFEFLKKRGSDRRPANELRFVVQQRWNLDTVIISIFDIVCIHFFNHCMELI